jgi:hypothetical protein
MRLVLLTFPVAIAAGYVLGGRLRNLSEPRLRYPAAGLAGLAVQMLPVRGTAGLVFLVGSIVVLLAFAAANWRMVGFVMIVAGLWANLVVVALNQGMPVTPSALVASGQTDGLEELQDGGRRHLATPDDDLVFLADAIPLPAPVHRAVSIGDVVAFAGAMWFIVAGMVRRPDRRDEVASFDADVDAKLDVVEATT